MYKRPLIFDIHRSAMGDGAGLRTTVFFKGCNLNCYWCHNPEGRSPEREPAFFEEKCIGCGACQRGDKICPQQARKNYGRTYEINELADLLAEDKMYYDATGGGVTLSGGECMLYPDYVADLAKACNQRGISVAVDTAGDVEFAHFEKVLPYVQLFLYDIKALDPELHCKATGVRNDRILDNLERLRLTGKQIIVRVPVIPNFNEGEIENIQRYCDERQLPMEKLSYHNYGDSKRQALQKAREK